MGWMASVQSIAQLDGFELAADAWDKHVLPARVTGYDATMLDLLCYSGEAAWTRLTPPPSVDPSAALPPRPIRIDTGRVTAPRAPAFVARARAR